jgi:copper chaperone
METIVIDVAGMSCEGCVKSLGAALKALPGVEQVDVSLAKGQASVTCDPSLVSIARLRNVVEGAGFDTPR